MSLEQIYAKELCIAIDNILYEKMFETNAMKDELRRIQDIYKSNYLGSVNENPS